MCGNLARIFLHFLGPDKISPGVSQQKRPNFGAQRFLCTKILVLLLVNSHVDHPAFGERGLLVQKSLNLSVSLGCSALNTYRYQWNRGNVTNVESILWKQKNASGREMLIILIMLNHIGNSLWKRRLDLLWLTSLQQRRTTLTMFSNYECSTTGKQGCIFRGAWSWYVGQWQKYVSLAPSKSLLFRPLFFVLPPPLLGAHSEKHTQSWGNLKAVPF